MDTKTRTITLKKKDIFFDIDALSLDLTRVSGDDVRKSDAVATDTSTITGARTFTRLADKRVADVRQMLKDFLVDVTKTGGDDLLVASDYVITLDITPEFPDSMLDSIIALAHDYVVKASLADWYTEIGTGPSANLIQLAADSLLRIKELIYQRPIPEML